MYCPKCGTEQISEGNFCYKCGCKLIRESEAEVNINNKESYKCVDNQAIVSKKNDSKFKHKKILAYSIIAIISIIVGVSVFIYKYTADRNVSNQKSSISDSKESIEEQLKSVINLNAKAMQDEDMDKYLSTMIIPDDQLSQTKETITKLFKNYDLQYTIEDFKVLTTDSEDAQVQVVQTTKKLAGGDFRDNRITAIHHLKQINGEWKIFKTDTKNIEYINEKSSTQQETAKNVSLNQEQAVAIMKKMIPNGNFEYDHDETKDGVEYYVIRQVGKGAGTTPTVGWFYVGKKDGGAFKYNLANNTFSKMNSN